MSLASSRKPSPSVTDLLNVLEDPAGTLMAGAALVLDQMPQATLARLFEHQAGKSSSILLRSLKSAVAGVTPGSALEHVQESYKEGRTRGERHRVRQLMQSYTLRRSAAALTNAEKALLRGMAALHAEGAIDTSEWESFFCELVWADGGCQFALPPDMARDGFEPTARKFLTALLKEWFQPYDTFLENGIGFLAQHKDGAGEAGRLIASLLRAGAGWMEPRDIADSGAFELEVAATALCIGHDSATGSPVAYEGAESLITIAGPGTGKSQAQVIPNLLTYPGSVFVLDVKGELWQATAAHRQKSFGLVYRFSPADIDGMTHRYNPFDFVSTDAVRAANDCESLSAQIVPPDANSRDSYWNLRARDYLWAFATLVAITAPVHERNLARVMDYLAIPTGFKDLEATEFLKSSTYGVLLELEAAAQAHDLPALQHTADAIRSGLTGEDRLESVLDTARAHLSVFARSPVLREATRGSDWQPLDLRFKPGMTVYICITGDQIEAYMPLVRVILQQHANVLLNDFSHRPGEPPITFFLDEMPQLGHMESLQRMLDVGRGAGLRLWLFAQYLGQLRSIYQERADGLVNACRVRCFMQPDNDAVKFLSPQLGTRRSLLSGEEEPLAQPFELMGRAFADKIIVTARGEAPMRLERRFAWESSASLMTDSPPHVPSILGTRR